MTETSIAWPTKTRELQSVGFDSTRWNGFRFRDDDVVVATWSKSGTTLTQQIVTQLIFNGQPGLTSGEAGISPWLDLSLFPLPAMLEQLEAQLHRRCVKTHLPLDALVFSPAAKYIYVGRDARDVLWSYYNHHAGYNPFLIDALNNVPNRVGPPLETVNCGVRDYYLHWLATDTVQGFPFPSFWDHVQGWWAIRQLPNVLFLHFNQLTADLSSEVRRVGDFLGIEIDEVSWPAILEHCSLNYMRKVASEEAGIKMVFKDGADTFFNKGTNGRWKDVLSAAEIARCDEVAAQRLTPDCAHWLRTGELPA